MSLNIANISRIFRLRCWADWAQERWISFAYTCNLPYYKCRRVILIAASEYTYHRCSSLRKPENNITLLLTWSSSIHGRPLWMLSEWASSEEVLNLCQRLVRDFQDSQKPEQLALILAALLCRGRLLSYTSKDTARLINGCYLADLGVLLNDESLSNQRTIFERIGFSFLRVLITLGDEYESIIQFLAVALDNPPFLDPFDGLTDQYVAERIKNKLSHLSACKEVKGLRLMKAVLEPIIGVGFSCQRINSISEGYWMINFLGQNCEDIRQISAANIASLVGEFCDWMKIWKPNDSIRV